ncbi:UvrD-helicase domain-containing protein [Patescibacteria group bacterium]|nr:UvrD-helicase domain-containing protein [Patescibacteria group bacterium]
MLDDLNDKQREVVLFDISSPLLVIAGAGSGKTKALTYKIAYLIKEVGFHPSEIMATTFTNKAATEMKERVENLIGKKLYFPYMGTMHSIFLSILRIHGSLVDLKPYFAIFDDDDQRKLIRNIIKENNIPEDIMKVNSVSSMISNLKGKCITPNDFEVLSFRDEYFVKIYSEYEKKLKANNAIDFDDILLKSLYLFKENDNLREEYREKLKYVLVDEYQDINILQHDLLREISETNVCFVGDPDQNIYSWRGTDIKSILSFENDYPGGTLIKLEQNYRSTKRILSVSQSIIVKNSLRFEKNLWTENDLGLPIKIYQAQDELDEADYIVNMIKIIGGKLSDFAILYRTNAQSRILEERFLKANIQYRIYGGLKFYQRKEIKDIISYIRFAMNFDDTISLLRIINTPQRKIGNVTISKLQEEANLKNITLGRLIMEEGDLPQNVLNFKNIIDDIKLHMDTLSPRDFIKYIIDIIKYRQYLMSSNDGLLDDRLENIDEFIGVGEKYSKIEDMISDISLMQGEDQSGEISDNVIMMSLHSAKGLEFRTVFIVGMEENIFPHLRSFDNIESLEEERRLCYVGMTRAKERLYLTFAIRRSLYGFSQNNNPSRFLSDIPIEHVELDY